MFMICRHLQQYRSVSTSMKIITIHHRLYYYDDYDDGVVVAVEWFIMTWICMQQINYDEVDVMETKTTVMTTCLLPYRYGCDHGIIMAS